MYDEEYIDPADWADEDYRKTYKEHYKGDKTLKYTCPDCGTKNAISQWHKIHGYHCDACTRKTEQGW